MARLICDIARDIKREWKTVNPAIWEAYMAPLLSLRTKDDNYYFDSASSVVNYALCNMTTFRGEQARKLKAELKEAIK